MCVCRCVCRCVGVCVGVSVCVCVCWCVCRCVCRCVGVCVCVLEWPVHTSHIRPSTIFVLNLVALLFRDRWRHLPDSCLRQHARARPHTSTHARTHTGRQALTRRHKDRPTDGQTDIDIESWNRNINPLFVLCGSQIRFTNRSLLLYGAWDSQMFYSEGRRGGRRRGSDLN